MCPDESVIQVFFHSQAILKQMLAVVLGLLSPKSVTLHNTGSKAKILSCSILESSPE